MVSGGGGGPLWGLFASSDTIPYAVLAATVSLGIVLIGGLAAMGLKGRTGLPHGFKRHPTPPLPDPVLGHAKRQAPIADRPAERLPSAGSGESTPVNGFAPDAVTPNGATPEPTAPTVDESGKSAAEPHEDLSPGSS